MPIQRIKVLFIFHYTTMGGAERLIFDITDKLDKSRYHPIACCLVPTYKATLYEGKYTINDIENANALANKIFDEKGIPYINIAIKSIFNYTPILKLVRLIRKEKIKVVFCLDMLPERTIGLLAGALSMAPGMILSCHYDTYDDNRKRYLSLFDKLLLRFTAKLTATSSYQKQRLVTREKISPEKVQVIYNGVDVALFHGEASPLSKEDFGISARDKVVGIVARLVPCKGHDIFLKAAKLTLEKLPETNFFIVGGGTEQRVLEGLCEELDIETRVRFLGERDDISELLTVFDVAVMCSYSENFPISILEYMASEKPVVATKVGGIPEAIINGESGLLVEPGNPEQLSEAVVRLLTDDAYAHQMARNARERAVHHFSIHKMLSTLEELFASLSHAK